MIRPLLLLVAACAHPPRPSPPAPTPPAEAAAAEPAAAEAPAAPEPMVDAAPLVSVKPGINDRFLQPELDVDSWAARFSAESREVVALQPEVLAALGLTPGMSIADIGAGTGLYVRPFADLVGPSGHVYAVDISPPFLERLRQMAADAGWSQVHVVEGTETSVQLPPASIDAAFICDTYHHFEYPQRTLDSLHAALRPGGSLFLLDFERIEGKSSPFILGHVRAGREVFAAEIHAAGFSSGEVIEVGLQENYLMRFERLARVGTTP